MSRIYDLLEKFAAGTCTEGEFEELMQLLKANENDDAVRSDMRKFYNSLDSQVVSDVHIDEQGGMFQNEGPVVARRPVVRRIKRAALALCAVAVIALAWKFFLVGHPVNKAEDPRTISKIYTPAGSRTSVVLPDGTEVWLNSFSTLTYSTADFNSGRREVSLVGEALFKVKHDSLHLFLVHTRNFDVTDLGTVFNVSAYPEDKSGQASLISGSIEVTTKGNNGKKITLVPNQRIIVRNDNKSSVVSSKPDRLVAESTIKPIKAVLLTPQISLAPDTAWMVNKLFFTEESFYELAEQMQRRYNVEIIFRSERARNFKFTGRFEEENIEEALKELQAIAPFTYRRTSNEIYID
ncbi:FecR family protein [Puia sp. P3]|uniref:FecR family protein n=1 Tax=Puia sp. P3 TaxID=3423952 RepID=UPI003D66E65D